MPAYAPAPSCSHTFTHTHTYTQIHTHTHTPGIDTKDGPGLKVFQRQTKWAGKDAVVVGMDGKYNNIKEMTKVEAAFADASTKSAVSFLCIYIATDISWYIDVDTHLHTYIHACMHTYIHARRRFHKRRQSVSLSAFRVRSWCRFRFSGGIWQS